MRCIARATRRSAAATILAALQLSAQVQSRDSAGIRIVSSARPAWNDSQALRLDSTPRLVIGNATDSAYRLSQVRSVMVLSDGRIAVADGASLQLRLFSSDGRFHTAGAGKGTGPGELQQIVFIRRLRGDSIAIISNFSTVQLYSGTAQYARTLTLPETPNAGTPRRSLLVAMLNDGTRIAAPMSAPEPRAVGMRWIDSLDLRLVAPDNTVVRQLGTFGHVALEQVASGLTQPWLSPIAAFAGGDDRFYAGYGDRYEIRVFDGQGILRSIIRRSWTPTPITRDDWKYWVTEWSKRWIRSSGEQRDREIDDVLKSPYARQNPAFSEMIVDQSGRLWVRDAHWQDAIGAGTLNDMPIIPSRWSVFDTAGSWLCDVTMPAGFQVFDIGADYVAGRTAGAAMNQAVIYRLRTNGK